MEAPLNDMMLVKSLRQGHQAAVAHAAAGNLSLVCALPDDAPETHVYVVKVLDVHPALGKVPGRRLMATLGIGQFARMSDLTSELKASVLVACGEKP
jgi:hypothetical protein